MNLINIFCQVFGDPLKLFGNVPTPSSWQILVAFTHLIITEKDQKYQFGFQTCGATSLPLNMWDQSQFCLVSSPSTSF